MGKKVRIGIIGAGQIAGYHMEEYAQMPDVELVAVCDQMASRAADAAAKYHIPNAYQDYAQMLERDDLDAVDICLHNALHAKATIDVLNSKKHAYCEKPIADSYQNGRDMLDAAQVNGRMLHIQLGHIYRPYARAVKRLIDGGALGELYHARTMGMRRRGRPYVDGYGSMMFVQKQHACGGALMDVGVYKIALMLYLMGQPKPTRITGATYQKTGMDPARKLQSGYDVEELATGFIRFENGLTMELFDAWAVHLDQIDPCSLLGAAGSVKFSPDVFSYHTTLCDLELDCTGDLIAMDTRWRNTIDTENDYISSQAHWVAALQGRVPLLPTAQIALDTMLIQEGIYLSAERGQEVLADEIIAGARRK
ncbi:Gfo/Idh/MocA family oxidoreductase [Eubacteriales bacterium OttesenSCG-928-N13]|nr:Gfo/Idh/MocA family oxidoreductase [Eubacteriales bacterium OttesenSCG-928-N13]